MSLKCIRSFHSSLELVHTHTHTRTHAHTHIHTHTHREDTSAMNNLLDAIRTNFNERYDELRRRWGGGTMGAKAQAAKFKSEKFKAKEMASKM